MTTIEIVYIMLLVSVTVIRKYFTAKFKPEKEQLKQSSITVRLFLGLMGITMLLPVLKIWIDLFPWANYPLNTGLQWLGNLVFYWAAISFSVRMLTLEKTGILR